jgi:hypothetical protein
LVLKNPFVFGCAIIVLVALQVGTSYLSFQCFLGGDWPLGLLFMFFVPGLAFLMVLYFIWFRRKRRLTPPAKASYEDPR